VGEAIARPGCTSLALDGLQQTRLPETIGQLTTLSSLNVSGNRLRELPNWLSNLVRLEKLDISNNALTSLPEFLGGLTALRLLDASQNMLTRLPRSLGQLRNLEYLILSDNQLSKLPDTLGLLHRLQSLVLTRNHIGKLPEALGRLAKLRFLMAAENQLTTLPESLGQLSELQDLVLSNNHLTVLPESLRSLTSLTGLYLHGNEALGLPAEVLGARWERVGPEWISFVSESPASPGTILDYYFSSRGKDARRLNEAKLILVGRGGVGKTCLVKRLTEDTFNDREPETPGIEIRSWHITVPDGDSVHLHLWDFGGQEILHATHQFFLTESSVYLLVLTGREGLPTQDAEYWLQLIRSFGGDSPVIIALNKSKSCPFDVNRGLLLEKYPFIVDFVITDCAKPPLGISRLKVLVSAAAGELKHRKTIFPAEWFKVKDRLAGMKENYLTWEQYQEICRALGVPDAVHQHSLAESLHRLGIALNYEHDLRLKETSVLNPRWVTEGIYSLLRAVQKGHNKAVLSKGNLASILDLRAYPKARHEFLMSLMESFQLCFRLPGQEAEYLVPELLGESQPDITGFLESPGLGFRYQYTVLPEGLLPRFIVQTNTLSEKNPQWRWRAGVVVHRDNCDAVVRADARERRVDIHITGPEAQRRGVLAIIREKFDEQHRDLKGLEVVERVPVPGQPGVTVSYELLLTLEGEHEEYCWPEGSRKKVPVWDLLNGLESRESRDQRRKQLRPTTTDAIVSRKHVFLSYCHDNVADVQQLHDDLIALGEAVWWDKDILPGRDWKLEIRKAMINAYAVVLCLSRESQARTTTGIYPEAYYAIELYKQHAPGSIFLIPIRLSACEIPPIELYGTSTLADVLQYADLFPPSHRAEELERLIEAIRAAPNHPGNERGRIDL